MSGLTELPNIGPVVAAELEQIGIHTPAELRELGAREAWLRIRALVDPGACLHMLLGLEGAVEGIKKSLLSPGKKDEMKAFFQEHNR